MSRNTVIFNNEVYEYSNENGYTTLKKEKNKNGFKITINISNDPNEHKIGLKAVEDFFVKNII